MFAPLSQALKLTSQAINRECNIFVSLSESRTETTQVTAGTSTLLQGFCSESLMMFKDVANI